MKRKLALILTMTIMSTLLVGCKKELPKNLSDSKSNSYEIEENAELTLWTENVKYGENIAKAFNEKYPKVKVNVEEAPGMGGSMEKLELDGPAGIGPDVLIVPHDKVTSGIESGIITSFNEKVTNELKDKVMENALKVVSNEGKVYGAPVSIETQTMFYNKDLVSHPAKDFNEIFEDAKNYNDEKENLFTFLFNPNYFYDAYSIISADGFSLFGPNNDDEKNPTFDSEEFLKGLENLSKFNEIIPINAKDLKDTSVPAQFKSGKVKYILGGPWNIQDFKNAGINYGVALIPTINGKTTKTMGGVQAACVSAYTNYPNASMELAKFMAEEEGAQILYDSDYKITALKDDSKINGLNEDTVLKTFVEQFKTAVPTPTVGRMPYISQMGESVLATVFNGQLSAEDGVKKATEEWDSLIKSE